MSAWIRTNLFVTPLTRRVAIEQLIATMKSAAMIVLTVGSPPANRRGSIVAPAGPS
jgi:hypothetical protein